MAQVNLPAKRSSQAPTLFGLAGAVAGAASGGGIPGAMAGASVGQTAGGLLTAQNAPPPTVGGGNSEAMAMARKNQQSAQDNLAVLKKAEADLPGLPEDLRQQYSPAIIQARMLEEQKRGLA